MLTATDFRILREKCPDNFETYLKMLDIPCPDWAGGDEFKISAQLDDKITANLSRLLKSESVIAGYMTLLKVGHVSYSFSESDKDLLEKILSNKDAISRGATQPEVKPQPQVERSATMPQPDAAHSSSSGKASLLPMLFGGLLLVVGVWTLFGENESGGQKVGGIAALLLGFSAVFFGFKRRTAEQKSTPVVPQQAHITPEAPRASSALFTREEIQHVFDVLSVTKIILAAV